MNDQNKSKDELIKELRELRQENNSLMSLYDQDITGRKSAEEELLTEKRLLSAIIENMPDQIYYKDRESRFMLINPAGASSCGAYSIEEVIGKTDFDFFPNDLAKQYFEDEQTIMNSGMPLVNHEEITTNKRTEEVRWNLTTKVPITDNTGKVVGLIGINRDITGRKKVGEELNLKNEDLIRINGEKDKFFSIIAHDLRGPFNGFLGFTKMLVEELDSLTLKEIQLIAMSMRTSATNLFRLLENLLEWSRLKQGLISFDPAGIQLSPIVLESLAILMEAAKNKNIEIVTHIPDDIAVFADSNMLQSIIRNLVSNAIKFTPKGGKISLSASIIGDKQVEIAVKDTGIGMNPALVDNLFRLDVKTSRKGTEGEHSTGLGLIICKDFIEKHGGQIS